MEAEPLNPRATRYAAPTVHLAPALERERLVRPAEVAAMLHVSVATVYRLAREGKMPRPRRLTHRVSGWPLSVIRDLIHGESPETSAP